jgi:hypothetical protein
MLLHQGESRFNGESFSVVATGIDRPSQNIKTGPMVALTILPSDSPPVEANRHYTDDLDNPVSTRKPQHTVCGDCPLAGHHRGCYVGVEQSTTTIYNKLQAGGYPAADLTKLVGKSVRFGAWGEPSLIPIKLVRQIVSVAKNWTGYTHQWRKAFAKPYRQFLMASVESVASKLEANAKGWRTFRIVSSRADLLPDEVLCPATTQRAKPVQCVTCGLCRGASLKAKNVAVIAHGGYARLSAITSYLKGV